MRSCVLLGTRSLERRPVPCTNVEPSAKLEKQPQDVPIECLISKHIAQTPGGRAANAHLFHTCHRNAEDLTGKLSLQRCEDAAALEKIFEEQPDEWRLWSLLPNDGEMAALLRRVSDHQAEFQVQIPDLKQARDHAQWTSRKIREPTKTCSFLFTYTITLQRMKC